MAAGFIWLRFLRTYSMIGLPNKGTRGLGISSVRGRSLVPNPAARIKALTFIYDFNKRRAG
ncbi:MULTISPECIES: hypothetical protein [Thermodesulfobacterium]|uniref:Uncharacterized protein n=1 Tax=Thermodesulfobacterium commune DSM 2178 TaxID=289377 RepID=A0A075WYT3_9BACT|nr:MULTISPECIES: hypothetical protein [Thermodesulfobacterium]AIH03822.1 hypothetical protein HL41_02900 [Thermodesulfobacterium commune DSM 2178]